MIETQNLEEEELLLSKKSAQDSDRKNYETTIPAHAYPNSRTKFTLKVEIT